VTQAQAQAQAQAHAQAQQFLFHCENGLCLSLHCNKWKRKIRHNTSKRIFTTHGYMYVWPLKTLDPDYLAPKKFGMF